MIRLGRKSVCRGGISAEDAGRTDIDYLCQGLPRGGGCGRDDFEFCRTRWVLRVPEEYGAMFKKCVSIWAHPQVVTLSAHCHDDLGMAVANSLAAVRAGVRPELNALINGIGERAGNAALEEVVVALAVRKESFAVTHKY